MMLDFVTLVCKKLIVWHNLENSRRQKSGKWVHMRRSKVKIVKIPDMTAEEYRSRFEETGLSLYQMNQLTDVSGQRQKRVMEGDPKSLVQDQKTGQNYVPKSLVLALLCVENGFLLDQNDEMPA